MMPASVHSIRLGARSWWRRLQCVLAFAVLGWVAHADQPTEPPVPPTAPPALPPDVLAARPTAPPDTAPPSEIPDPTELIAQLELLQQFLELSPAELRRIRQTVALIERLSPEERSRMRERLATMRLDLNEVDQSIALFAKHLPPRERPAFRRFWMSLSHADREQLSAQFSQLDRDARAAWVDARLSEFHAHEEKVLQRLRADPALAGE